MIKKDSLQIDQDNIKNMNSNVYKLVSFDRNTQMNMRMIEERNNKIKEEREMDVLKQSAIESQIEKKIRHAKNLKRRKIKAAFYMATGIKSMNMLKEKMKLFQSLVMQLLHLVLETIVFLDM